MSAARKCFKLCTFDITNTLLKFNTTVGEQYTQVAQLYGVHRNADKITTAFSNEWKEMTASHPNFGVTTGMTARLWWKELIRRIFSDGNSQLTTSELECISYHLYEAYKFKDCWRVVPGTQDLLKTLMNNGIHIGVISNFDERLSPVLSSSGLRVYFDFIIASCAVRMAKPDRKIFDFALQKVPGVKHSDALHIGDDVNLDYLAAKNAGWSSLLICEKSKVQNLKDVDPDDIVHSIEDIKQYIFHGVNDNKSERAFKT